MMQTLNTIKEEVDRLAIVIRAAASSLPTYGRNLYDAHPHIEVDARGYHYVVVERGKEIQRNTTSELDDLLFFIFDDVTFGLAGEYEMAHREQGVDIRRLLFRRQEEIMGQLSPHWAERAIQDHLAILRKHPYDDVVSIRAALCAAYRKQGYAPDLAWQMACQQYPLPTP